MSNRQLIEIFHILFCQRLAQKVDRQLMSLKGGCNLRFFHHSIRYSEDIDFDVVTVSVETLRKNVEKILADTTFNALLRSQRKIEIADWSVPKQTEVTQRWKVQLKVGNEALTLPTKIEFSRREKELSGALVEPLPTSLITEYSIQPFLFPHYELARALEQKLMALVHRTETQARDVIDLKVLKDRLTSEKLNAVSQDLKIKAVETLMSVSYDDFKSQVWPYLMEEFQEFYDSKKSWSELQDEVVRFIEEWPAEAAQ